GVEVLRERARESRTDAEIGLRLGHLAAGGRVGGGERAPPALEPALRRVHARPGEVERLAVAAAERQQPEREWVVAPLLDLRQARCGPDRPAPPLPLDA